MTVEKELEQLEIETIKAQLDAMEVKYHHNANLKSLKKLLGESLAPVVYAEVKDLTEEQRAKALDMVRVSITCRNPHKGARKGEFFTVGNSKIGMIKAFIPYNVTFAEDCYIPRIFIEFLKRRKFLHTSELSEVEQRNSIVMHRTSWLAEFAVVELGAE